MGRVHETYDAYGTLIVDDRGYAHRGPEYASRIASGGVGHLWNRNSVGGFDSVLPIKDPRFVAALVQAARAQHAARIGDNPWAASDDLGYGSSSDYGGSSVDTWPSSQRPEWLKPFAHVTGSIPSAPLDLATRMDAVTKALKSAGWTVVVRSVGTDFTGDDGRTFLGVSVNNPLGIPKIMDQPIDMLLHRTDRTYIAKDAQDALNTALHASNVNYSPIGAWTAEVNKEVIQPTIATVQSKVSTYAPYLMVGVGVAAALYLNSWLPQRHH